MFLVAVSLDDLKNRVIQEVSNLPVRFGRRPERLESESVELMKIPWTDRLVSRNHGLVTREGNSLIVQRMPALPGRSRPNAFYSNTPARQRQILEEPLRLEPGQSFSVGSQGTTAFDWLESRDKAQRQRQQMLQKQRR